MDAENSQPQQRGRPWPKGLSGNPRGKPPGAKHKALIALDAIGAEGAAEVLRRVVTDAKAGDMRAAEILLRRVWPERKGRPIALTLPEMQAAIDLPAALSVITQAVANGNITPDEGQAVAAILEAHRRAIETADLERRIAALEGADAQHA